MSAPGGKGSSPRLRWAVTALVVLPLLAEIYYLWTVGPIFSNVPIAPPSAAPIPVPEFPGPPPAPVTPPTTPAPPEPAAPGPMPSADVAKLKRMLAAASAKGEMRERKTLPPPAIPAPVGGMRSLVRFRDCPQCPQMVVMPTSRFSMGSNDNPWEQPRHVVNIRHRYAIAQTETTEQQWRACADDGYCALGPSGKAGRLPAVMVNRQDAQDYVEWLRAKTGRRYRLPTEAEWALATRGGSTTSRFWGPDRQNQCRYANGADRALKAAGGKTRTEYADCNDRHARRAPVASFKPNAYGLHDTAGNVWEWVQDCWAPHYLEASADGRAYVRKGCPEYVIRGGSWRMRPEALRSAERGRALPAQRSDDLGFRVAAD